MLRTSKEGPIIYAYSMRQTLQVLEKEAHTKKTAPALDKLERELTALKRSMENTYSETLEGWSDIRFHMFVLLFCCLMLTGILALYFSHRVAGPLFRIGRCIDQYSRGKDSGPVRLRKRDQYKDLAASLEKLRVELLKTGYLKSDEH